VITEIHFLEISPSAPFSTLSVFNCPYNQRSDCINLCRVTVVLMSELRGLDGIKHKGTESDFSSLDL